MRRVCGLLAHRSHYRPIVPPGRSDGIADKACDAATLTYVRSFTSTLRAKTYRAGLGFSSSGAKAIATAENRTDLPGNLWCARWNGQETNTRDWPWDPKLYTDHSRGHHCKADSRETRGAHTLTVGRNAWDAPVAVIG